MDPRRPRQGRSAPTARRAWPRSTAWRSTSTCSTRPIRARRGDIRARARPARGRGPRDAGRALERQPPPARRGARARSRHRRLRSRSAPVDDRALRGGVVERCAELGIAVIAHSPLGGPRRAAGACRGSESLAEVAARARRRPPAEVALAWLLALSPAVVAIPGARRPETARSAARRRRARLDAGRAGRARRRIRRSAPGRGAAPARRRRRRGRGRDGHPRSREEPARRGVRRPRLPAPQPRRARRVAARARRRARRAARVGRAPGRPRQHLPHPRRAQLRDRGGEPAWASRCGASGSTRRSPQAQVNLVERLLERFGSAAHARGAARARPARARRADADLADAQRCASSSRRRPTRGSRSSRRCRSSARRPVQAGPACSSPPRRSGGPAGEARARAGPIRMRRTWSSTGAPAGSADALGAGRRPPLRRGLGPGGRRRCARTPPGRRAAGAGRRSRACPSRSRAHTTSICAGRP